MSFLLNTTGDNTIWIVLAIGVVLAVCFYIYKNKTASSGGNDDTVAADAAVTNEPAESAPNNDDEIIAVIAAAIAMAESESNGLKFKVVSFRRI